MRNGPLKSNGVRVGCAYSERTRPLLVEDVWLLKATLHWIRTKSVNAGVQTTGAIFGHRGGKRIEF